MKNLFPCPCCGYLTLGEEPPGTYLICRICFWEDDGVQYNDPDFEGGANNVSLRTAQYNFNKFGACEVGVVAHVRRPTQEDIFAGPRDVTNIMRFPISEMFKLFVSVGQPDLSKLLDIYSGLLDVKDSNFIFNVEQLLSYLSIEEITEYILLNRRFESTYSIPQEMIELTDEEAQRRILHIRETFLNEVFKQHEVLFL